MYHSFAKSSWSVFDDAVTERADILGCDSTVGYYVTPHYQLLVSLHIIEIFKKVAAENMVKILLIMIAPICNIGSPLCGCLENCYFSVVVLLHRSNRHINSCWAHRMFEISSHKVTSILSPSKLKFRQSFCKKFVVSFRRCGDRTS